MKMLTTLLLLFSVVAICLSQRDVIHFENPSFEDNPHDSYVPKGWYDCGFEQTSPPDVQPNDRHFVQTTAFNGETFLGMVTRDNKTWERIGQSLKQPIVAGECYAVGFALAKSPIYLSYSSLTGEKTNFNKAIKLKVWGGHQPCMGLEPLAESKVVDHTNWKEHLLILNPLQDYSHLIIEATYQDSSKNHYNGNILLDHLSPILRIPCEELKNTESAKWYRLFRKQMKIHNLYREIPSPSSDSLHPHEIGIQLNLATMTNPKVDWLEAIGFIRTEEPDKILKLVIREKSIGKAKRLKKRVISKLKRAGIALEKITFDIQNY